MLFKANTGRTASPVPQILEEEKSEQSALGLTSIFLPSTFQLLEAAKHASQLPDQEDSSFCMPEIFFVLLWNKGKNE